MSIRSKYISVLFPVFLFLGVSSAMAGSPESWTLRFTSNMNKVHPGPLKQDITASGQAQLSIDEKDVLTDSGQMSLTESITGSSMKSFGKGSGPIKLTGRRDGRDLYFQINGPDIPVKGTTTIMGLGKTAPYETTFTPATVASADMRIERKTGATSTQKHDLAGLKVVTNFALSGGMNAKEEKPATKGAFPKEKNLWTLELDSAWTTVQPKVGAVQMTMQGMAEFPLPIGDGPAVGDGPLTVTGGGSTIQGKLILRGEIKEGFLIFQPKATFETTNTQTPGGGMAQSDFGSGFWAFGRSPEPVKLPVQDGAEIKNNINDAASNSNGCSTFRLKGKSKEHWLVTIEDFNIDYLVNTGGSGKGSKGAGLKVHVKREVEVEIENKQFKQGIGKSSFVSIQPYSYPAWAYNVKSLNITISGSGLDTEAEKGSKKNKTPYIFPQTFNASGQKSGSRLKMTLPDPCGYTLGMKVILNEKEILNRGYTIGKYGFKERTDTERRELTTWFTVTLVDGWKNEDAPAKAESRTVITVKKLKK